MKIQKALLVKALEKVKPGLASRELIQQSTSFAFLGDRVLTYNDEISISHPVPGLDVKGAVKAQALYDLLNRTKEEEIDVQWDADHVVISAGRAKAGLVFEQEVTLPVEEVADIEGWAPLPKEFASTVALCYPCCAQDMSRPLLTCVHIAGEVVEASDSYQIIHCTIPAPVPVERFLLPYRAARELVRYSVQEVAGGTGWVHFRTADGTVFSSRVLRDEFPDTSVFLAVEGVEFAFPKAMTEALERATIFSRDDLDTQGISLATVKLSDRRLEVTAKNEFGWFEETVRVRYKGPAIQFVVGTQLLIAILKRLQQCVIGEGRIKFVGDGWAHVTATIAEGEGGEG